LRNAGNAAPALQTARGRASKPAVMASFGKLHSGWPATVLALPKEGDTGDQ
jgi:hypothetical protein